MKYLDKAFSILFMIILCACDNSKENIEPISIYLDIYVQNENGDNLLDELYFEKDLKLFYLQNNNLVEVFDSNMDAPRNFKFIDIEDNKVIRIFPNTLDDEYPITFLKWNENDMDTIKCYFKRSEDNVAVRLDSVWYNDINMIPNNTVGPTRGFEIVK